MERVLIAYAGSAGVGEIALVIGEQLCRAGLGVDVRSVARAADPDAYAAVVVGSTCREGRWAADAASYLNTHRVALAGRPLWLYERSTPGAGGDRVAPAAPLLEGVELPVRFGPDDLAQARSWGFNLGCQIRPLATPCLR